MMASPGHDLLVTVVEGLLHSGGMTRAPDSGDVDTAEAVMRPILALHQNNAAQWDREDDARRAGSDDALLAAAKRDIDRLNGARHGYIEEIDRSVFDSIKPRPEAPKATESPGLAIDRLSVLVIRLASTEASAASDTADAGLYAERLPRLRAQLDALSDAIASLFADLAAGVRSFCPYESLKIYRPAESPQDP